MNGEKLKALRKEAGLTTVALGNAVGLSDSMITHMEKGFKVPSVKVIERIADFFGVTIDELVRKGT